MQDVSADMGRPWNDETENFACRDPFRDFIVQRKVNTIVYMTFKWLWVQFGWDGPKALVCEGLKSVFWLTDTTST